MEGKAGIKELYIVWHLDLHDFLSGREKDKDFF